ACTDYGAHVARSLARELAAAGVVVISGLARGIDGWAHRGALDPAAPTVAVLGCGIDRDYPRAHAALAAQICERGLVVSEYPPGATPVTCADDVLEAIGVEPPPKLDDTPLGGIPGAVLCALSAGATTADELARATGLAASDVSAALTELELAGFVEARAGIYR